MSAVGDAAERALETAPAASPFGAWQAVAWSLARDLRIAVRTRAELGVQLLFYVIVIMLFPLSVGPEPALLRAIGPGVAWVAALLAVLLSLPRLFAADFADGSLEQMGASAFPLPALITGKVAAHWIATGAPLVLLSPVLALPFGLSGEESAILALGLLLGTGILSLLGAIGAALTLGVRGGGALLALLVLPLSAPVLIFGAGAVDAVRAGLSPWPQFSLLAAGLLLAIVGAPFAASAAVRIALD